ncbi:MAG: phosphate-binding protein [Chlorobium sp.]|nr:MAG: phosphate-binding protein [Chlorobium sp.]
MNIHALSKKAFMYTKLMLLPFSLLVLINCSQQQTGDTARSGAMTLAADSQLEKIAKTQVEMFRSYYPEAKVSILPMAPVKTMERLLDKSARAALISGDFDAAEDSLFSELKTPLRKEPVALDAVVCIAARTNPVKTLSVKELASLVSGKGQSLTIFVKKDDYRLISVFSRLEDLKKNELHAWSCSNDIELIDRVSASNNAYGLLFSSSLESARISGADLEKIKLIPVSGKSTENKAYLPDRENIFEGLYPLVTTVYYVYYPGDALAAGFGSWISSAGQKAFERSPYIPFRLTQRTIILR